MTPSYVHQEWKESCFLSREKSLLGVLAVRVRYSFLFFLFCSFSTYLDGDRPAAVTPTSTSGLLLCEGLLVNEGQMAREPAGLRLVETTQSEYWVGKDISFLFNSSHVNVHTH